MTREAPIAIVTGASRGIGRATAKALAERGMQLAFVGRASPELEEAEELCRAAGAPSVRRFVADLAERDQLERAAQQLAELTPAPHVVIHNAGIVHRGNVEALSPDAWREQVEINLNAPFVLTRAVLPAMRRARRGRILFVASISSTVGTAGQSGYAATKWGILGFMKSLAEELRDSGLMTAAVLPGSVATRMLEGSSFPARMEAVDVARTLAFLALDASLAHNGSSVEMFGI